MPTSPAEESLQHDAGYLVGHVRDLECHVTFILLVTRRPEMSYGHYQSWADLLTVGAYHRRRPKYVFNMVQGIRTPVGVRI